MAASPIPPSGVSLYTPSSGSGYGGYKLTPQQIYATVRQAGFQGNDAVTATAIALAESAGITNNSLFTPGSGASVGLFQVTAGSSGGYSIQALTDPLTNAKQALALYNEPASGGGTRGFEPWTTYNTGAYKQYLSQATQAAFQWGADQSGVLAGKAPSGEFEVVNQTQATGLVGTSSGVNYSSFTQALQAALAGGFAGFGTKGSPTDTDPTLPNLGPLQIGLDPQGTPAPGTGSQTSGSTPSQSSSSSSTSVGHDIVADLELGALLVVGGIVALVSAYKLAGGGKGPDAVPELWWALMWTGGAAAYSGATASNPLCVLNAAISGKAGNCKGTLPHGGVWDALGVLLGGLGLKSLLGHLASSGGNSTGGSGSEGKSTEPDEPGAPEEPAPAPEPPAELPVELP